MMLPGIGLSIWAAHLRKMRGNSKKHIRSTSNFFLAIYPMSKKAMIAKMPHSVICIREHRVYAWESSILTV